MNPADHPPLFEARVREEIVLDPIDRQAIAAGPEGGAKPETVVTFQRVPIYDVTSLP